MKRYVRSSPNSAWIMPRKCIAWIILTMAVVTMLTLMLIELRRVLAIRSLHKRNQVTYSHQIIEPVNLTETSTVHDAETNLILERSSWNYAAVEELFGEHPRCSEKPYLLILVTSSPENFERREAIRKSWACADKWVLRNPRLLSKILFLVGRSSTKFLDILLKNEKDIAGDILIGDYLDTYRNLTLKVMHGFTWSLRHCRPVYVLKTDDDCFVNVPLLLQFLWTYNPVTSNLYAGRVRWSAPVVRDPNSRWFVSEAEHPRPRYAPYANGAGYVLSRDALKKLVLVSEGVPAFPNEDAYVGAVLNAAGVRPTYSARFVTHSGPWQTCNFLYLFVVHRVRATRQDEYQEMANRAVDQCSMDHVVKDWV